MGASLERWVHPVDLITSRHIDVIYGCGVAVRKMRILGIRAVLDQGRVI